ncbi:MAG: RsmB/NOP family class I SAM-dependent RNA methyltransferase [Candidatus Pacearchaeota archaeon]|jgi:NOL1/NOP2/sun family putative RNA methylase
MKSLKPEFLERMKKISSNKEDYENYLEILDKEIKRSIRCNKIKISPQELKKQLEKKSWKISQPWPENPEVMIIESELKPGELGKSIEHMLGYYYIQELASMLPIIALKPKKNEVILDLCASPGSKTTQIASEMNNTGLIIANEPKPPRINILSTNLERCGVSNTIITREDGIRLCEKLKQQKIFFDKILVDAPCSGEGTLRSSPKTAIMWNPKTIIAHSKLQKKLIKSSLEILKLNGELIYSTCTHAPEENEEIIDFLLKEFPNQIQVEKIKLPVKCRKPLNSWDKKEYQDTENACRIHPQDNDTEGFFLVKFKKVKE